MCILEPLKWCYLSNEGESYKKFVGCSLLCLMHQFGKHNFVKVGVGGSIGDTFAIPLWVVCPFFKEGIGIQKLVETMVMTCNKLLQNVKTKWINMLSHTKRVYVDHSLVVKMHVDITKPSFAFENLVLLHNLDLIGKKISIMP